MSADNALNRLPASELVKLLRARAVSPVEVLDAHLDAIQRINPQVNAICTVAIEQARAVAREAEHSGAGSGKTSGLLHGLPVVVKDVVETAGIRTTFGSPLFADYVPVRDAEVVARLRGAGAIILGKTNTPEFATGATTVNEVFGATRNPWNLALSPAGSSGGSAVAVATGMAALGHGTDYGGSVRVPASFCGIAGIRPTPGLVPNHPMPLPWDPGQVHGPLGRTVADAALMLDAMVGPCDRSPISMAPPWHNCLSHVERTQDLKGARIAYAPDIAGIGVDREVEEICRAAALGLADAGARVEETRFDASDAQSAYLAIRGQWMVGQQFERLDRIETFGENLSGNVRAGLKLSVRDVAAAETKRAELWHRFCDLFERYDFLATPTAAVLPFPVEQKWPSEICGRKLANYIEWIAPTFLITLAGLPAASVPAGLSTARLPVGLQIIGRRFAEPRILAVAKLVEQMNPVGWPTLCAEPER